MAARFAKKFGEEDNVWVPSLQGIRPKALREAVLLRVRQKVIALNARDGSVVYHVDFGDYPPLRHLVLAGDRLHAVTRSFMHVFDAMNGREIERRRLGKDIYGHSLREHKGQVFLLTRHGRGRRILGVASLNPRDGTELWSRLLSTADAGQVVESHVTAWGTRLMLLGDSPLRLTVLNTTSGMVEATIPLTEGRNASLHNLRPHLLPDGRILVPLLMRRRGSFSRWVETFELVLVDPSRGSARGVVWRYTHVPRKGHVKSMSVIGGKVVLLDESLGAVVLDIKDGRIVNQTKRLSLGGELDVNPVLGAQPVHDSLLLVLTQSRPRSPAHLAAFEVPDLKRRYVVQVADTENERAFIVESHGVLTISLDSRGRNPRGRIRLYDPLTGRRLQEIPLNDAGTQWFTAQVQNGFLIVTTNRSETYAFGPR